MFGGERDIRIVNAVYQGSLKYVQELIAAGYDVNEADEDGNFPTLAAASCNDFKMLNELVKAGADVDLYGPSGDSPLGYAKRFSNKNMIELIHNSINKQEIPYTRIRI